MQNIKLSIDTNQICKKIGDKEGLTLIKKVGFDAVDFSLYALLPTSPFLGASYREYAYEIRKHLDEINLVCNQAHAPFNLMCSEKIDITEPNYKAIVRSIEIASILGAKQIIVHPIYVPVGETVNGMSYEDYNYMYYKSLEPYCREFEINIAIENMFYLDTKRNYRRGMLHTPEALTSMIKRLNSPYFLVCADIGHLAVTGDEPENVIKEMDPSILKALHIHDNNYISDEHTLPYLGAINWEAVMSALKEIGYQGDITFEISAYFKNFPPSLIEYALICSEKVGRHLLSYFDN